MRMGYMVIPKKLVKPFQDKLGFYSCTVSTFEQYVLTELLSNGAFDKLKGMFGGKRRAGRTHFTYTKNESYNQTYEQDAECKTNEKVVSQEEIDRILDKIRKSGYDSLTPSEKQMLFDQSNK